MFEVLIVEDESAKRAEILRLLWSVDDFAAKARMTEVGSVFEAYEVLKARQFDILLLDIALPIRTGGDVSESAGLDLVNELGEGAGDLRTPGQIIGITAYPDLLERNAKAFSSWAFSLVLYSPSGAEWEEAIRSRIRHLLLARNAEREYDFDLGIVCALESPELEAIKAIEWNWNQTQQAGDHTIYFVGRFGAADDEKTVVAASTPMMGMPATMTVAGKMIEAFRPRYIAMTGMTAGVHGKTKLGDVIVANPCWDWGSGKWVSTSDGLKFEPAPFHVQLDPWVRERLREIAGDTALLNEIRAGWPAEKPQHELRVRVGPMASGASVLADGETVERVRDVQRDLLAVEMEAYGIFLAAQECAEPRPKALVLKSVVDHGDKDKNNHYQYYSAYTSARVLKAFAERNA